jgi:hyperosmotically inducible periplasmic protein
MKSSRSICWARALTTAVVFAAGATVQASESDDRIGPAFQQTYVYKTYLQDSAIQTESKDGAVTLTGTVAEEAHKMLAEETVASLPGVVRVDNQLSTPSEVAAENADIWIGRKIKTVLMFRRNVNAGKTDVEVTDGIVTLTGEAGSLAQKELTGSYVGDIAGVNSVNNEISVVAAPEMPTRTASEKLDDMSITAQVKTALAVHRSTSAAKTQVVTRNGEVMVTGIALNSAEKSLVTKLAADILGVASVKNEMTIAERVTQ